jgi:DNA-binding Lrp family transcriptional regulator
MISRKGAPAELDATDNRLLSHLREDARLPVSQLATLLDIPRAQVYARLERLEADGIIEGYTVRLGTAFSKTRMRAHVMIKTLPRQGKEAEAGLAGMAEVSAIYAISGEYDIIALVEAADSVAMNDLLDRIGMLDGVERTTTSVILAAKLER